MGLAENGRSFQQGGVNLGNAGARGSDTADDAASTKGGDDEPAQDSGDGGSKLSQEEASDFRWLKTHCLSPCKRSRRATAS